MGHALETVCRASTNKLPALPLLTMFRVGLKVQPVKAARVAFALMIHWVLPSKVESTTLNTPGPVNWSALEMVQFWNCIHDPQSAPVALTAGPLRPVMVQRSNCILASVSARVRLMAISPSKVKLSNMSPRPLGMFGGMMAMAQLLMIPPLKVIPGSPLPVLVNKIPIL